MWNKRCANLIWRSLELCKWFSPAFGWVYAVLLRLLWWKLAAATTQAKHQMSPVPTFGVYLLVAEKYLCSSRSLSTFCLWCSDNLLVSRRQDLFFSDKSCILKYKKLNIPENLLYKITKYIVKWIDLWRVFSCSSPPSQLCRQKNLPDFPSAPYFLS